MKQVIIAATLLFSFHVCRADDKPRPLPTPEPSNWFYTDREITEVYELCSKALTDMDKKKEVISDLRRKVKTGSDLDVQLLEAYDCVRHTCAVAAIISDEINFLKSLSGNQRWNFAITIMAASWNLDSVRMDADWRVDSFLQFGLATAIHPELISIHDDLKALHRLGNRLKGVPAETGLEH